MPRRRKRSRPPWAPRRKRRRRSPKRRTMASPSARRLLSISRAKSRPINSKTSSRSHRLRTIRSTDRCLCRRQPCNWHAIRRARNVIHADAIAELDRIRIAAMFAADPDLKIRLGLAAQFHGLLDNDAHAFLVDGLERIGFKDLQLFVFLGKLRVVVARHA